MCAVVTKDLGVDHLISMKKNIAVDGIRTRDRSLAKIKGYERCAQPTKLAGTHIIFHNSQTFYILV